MTTGELKIGDRVLKTRPLNQGLRAEMEREVLAAKRKLWQETTPELLRMAADASLPASVSGKLVEALVNRTSQLAATYQELVAYMDSPRGVAHTVWAMIRDEQPDEFGTLEQVLDFVDGVTFDSLQAAVDESTAKKKAA